MMNDFTNGKVPLLGNQDEKSKVRAQASSLVSLVRHMDKDGFFEPESAQLVNGQIQAVAGRDNICSAEDLVEMFIDELMPRLRDLIKQELATFKSD